MEHFVVVEVKLRFTGQGHVVEDALRDSLRQADAALNHEAYCVVMSEPRIVAHRVERKEIPANRR